MRCSNIPRMCGKINPLFIFVNVLFITSSHYLLVLLYLFPGTEDRMKTVDRRNEPRLGIDVARNVGSLDGHH